MNKTFLLTISLVVVLSTPSFIRMLRYGTFTVHDPHLFRQYEFNLCLKEKVFPCRWAPDSGFGFGEPLFNFYPQLSYLVAQPFIFLGLSIVNSVKISFIASLVLSSASMFILANYLFKNLYSGLLASVLYLYAPYRAVDVWVRGNLPEALSFIFFPITVLLYDKFLHSEKIKYLVFFIISLSAALLTHHLSFIQLALFLSVWSAFRISRVKKKILPLAGGLLITLGLAAFQIVPILLESQLVTLNKSLEDYYNFRGHFATLNQIFISREWGYGASLWGPKEDLSLSIGHFQWSLVLICLLVLFKNRSPHRSIVLSLFMTGLFGLFLTHNRSTFIWENMSFMARFQFPWRWLALAVFSLSLAAAPLAGFIKSKTAILLLIVAIIVWNISFFHEDIWLKLSDEDMFSGGRWDEQRTSSVHDFWPVYAPSPTTFASELPISNSSIENFTKGSHSASFNVQVKYPIDQLNIPIAYFPGWQVFSNNKSLPTTISSTGTIQFELPNGSHHIEMIFNDTPPRVIGNYISLLSLVLTLYLLKKYA